jgi:hypothetical protein
VPIVTIRKDAIAIPKQQGRKVFTLQIIAHMTEQGLTTGCAVILPALGYRIILTITTYGKVRYPLKAHYSSCRDRHPNLLKLRLIAPESL